MDATTPSDQSPSPQPHVAAQVSRRTFLWGGGLLLALQASGLRAATRSTPSTTSQPPSCEALSRTAYPPPLRAFIAKLNPDADDFLCERYVAEIQPIVNAWLGSSDGAGQDAAALLQSLSSTFRGVSLMPSQTIALRSSGPLRVDRWIYGGAKTINRKAFAAAWNTWLAPLRSVQASVLQIDAVQATGNEPLSVATEIHFNLVGQAIEGHREQRVGTWQVSWRKEAATPGAPAQWKVDTWTSGAEVRSRLTGPGFTEITASCLDTNSAGMAQLIPGIDHWRTVLDGASGIDVFGNHGVSVGDMDGEGFDSFYVSQPSGLPNRLYRNRGDGTFEDITEASGTGILDGTACALFVDFQNRGKQDLLVVRLTGPLLFENMGNGRFEPRHDAFHFQRDPQGTFTGAVAADYNRDGLLDVYFCLYSYYKGLGHQQYPSPYYDARNGPPNFLFRNRGNGTFEDVTVASGMDQNNDRFSFAASWCDDDNDGWPDLHVANDFGRKNLYRNNGDGTFTDVARQAGVEDYGPGMSSCWMDVDNDGLQDLYVANMWLAAGRRITADSHFLPGVDPAVRALYRKHNDGNSMFRNMGGRHFEDRTAAAGTANAGWSWSCAAWDFDNDGWDDLYVANGFVSGPIRYDLESFFWRQVAQRSLTPNGISPEYQAAWNAINELLRSDYTWSGYQRNAFFANNRDSTFAEVSGVLGLDLIDDSRALALSDFDHDGRLELVMKNRTGPQVRILRNRIEGLGHSITFCLRGHASNRDAIGAVVTLEAGATPQTRFVSAGSGFASQHTKALCFGVAEAQGPISISVRWPTGRLARYTHLPVNHRIQIEEGVDTIVATPYRITAREQEPVNVPAHPVVPSHPAVEKSTATWLIAPLVVPDLSVVDRDGVTRTLRALRGRPVLLTFLAAECGESMQQLTQLQHSPAGLSLFTVAVARGGDQAALEAIVRSTGFGFPVFVADDRAAGAWQIQYRYLFDRRRDMPLPASFLIDEDGAAVRVYTGVADPQRVAEDSRSSARTPQEQLARALPFPGPYYGAPMTHDYLSFGVAFTEYGYPDEAENAFQQAIAANPQLQVAWFNLGTIYLDRKMYPQARKYLNEAVALDPNDSDAWNNLGSLSGAEGKYDEALQEFARAAAANPHHANAVENMMRIYEFQSRPADAQKAIEALITQAPDVASLHLALSMTLVAQNNLAQARAELQTAIRLDPNNPDAINNLGAVLLRMGLPAEALHQFELCRRLDPDFDRAAINAALLYSKGGEPARARELLDEFLKRHPDDAAVRSLLQKLETQ
jgi:tetratricopeptide (TPR) repeat protein